MKSLIVDFHIFLPNKFPVSSTSTPNENPKLRGEVRISATKAVTKKNCARVFLGRAKQNANLDDKIRREIHLGVTILPGMTGTEVDNLGR